MVPGTVGHMLDEELTSNSRTRRTVTGGLAHR